MAYWQGGLKDSCIRAASLIEILSPLDFSGTLPDGYSKPLSSGRL